ncbi:MAG: hypothetical protein FH751_16100 [Firmicutes bacterium]|nr:hypothetical protein [Bacillota bacterium]
MITKKFKTIILIIAIFFISSNTILANNFFYDIWGHWAEEEILWATNDVPLFVGYKDGTFRPDDNIKRTEFITILFRAANLREIIKYDTIESDKTEFNVQNDNQIIEENKEVTEKKIEDKKVTENQNIENDTINDESILNYKDFNSNHWAYKNVEKVYNYINKENTEISFKDIFPGDKFNPEKPITRIEAVLLSSFFTAPPIKEQELEFTDISKDYKYYEQIKKLSQLGIIKGYGDNTFRGEKNITRAESTAIIKRVYKEMNFISSNYLEEINLIEDVFDNKFMYFGDKYFTNEKLSNEDRLYMNAIRTLEYLNIVESIPYELRDRYDSNPIATLKELRKLDYWNVVGVNNYLLKYDAFSDSKKEELIIEMINDYKSRDDIKDNESKLIFKKVTSFIEENKENISDNAKTEIFEGLKIWEESVKEYEERLNIIFLKSKLYINSGLYSKALELYNLEDKKESEIEIDSIENQKYFIFNKAYILLKMKKYNEAEEFLRQGFEDIKNHEKYKLSQKSIDKDFIGCIKKVLMEKEKSDVNFIINQDTLEE